ncbi:MAG: hypothetical protein ABUL62_16710 [Myxococcales bacterium]
MSAAAPSASAPSAEPTALAPPVATKPACRALEVIGRARVDGAPLVTNALLDGEHWLELDAGARVSLRHTVTTREFKLLGPATVLPCRAGAEQVLLAKGQLSTSANLGVRPGAEVLIATPQGTVRYGDAALDVELADKGLRVRVKQGEAWVEPEARGKPHFKNPVRSGGEARLPPRPAPAAELVTSCETAAQVTAESAARVLARDVAADAGAASLGERAAAHMRDRGKARMACAVAAAAIGALPATAATEREGLSESVAHADELWQRVPHVPNAPHAIAGQKN